MMTMIVYPFGPKDVNLPFIGPVNLHITSFNIGLLYVFALTSLGVSTGSRSVFDPKDAVESGLLEDPPRLRSRRADDQPPGVEVAVLVDTQQRGNALGVEESHLREVDHDLSGPSREGFDQRGPQLIGRRDVDLPPRADDDVPVLVRGEQDRERLNSLERHALYAFNRPGQGSGPTRRRPPARTLRADPKNCPSS